MNSPERIVRRLMQLGVDTITANPSMIDFILQGPNEGDNGSGYTDADLAEVKASWARNKASVLIGYARTDSPFPVWAITLQGDNPATDFLGMGGYNETDAEILDGLGLGANPVEALAHVRTDTIFGILVYHEHPDMAAAHYRILRYILNVGRMFLIKNGLDSPAISGAELAPDPRYLPDALYVRRVTLTVQVDEYWRTDDALGQVLYGPQIGATPGAASVSVYHEDSDPGTPTFGKVHPIDDDE